LTKETEDSIVNAYRACSDRRSRENKYDYGIPTTIATRFISRHDLLDWPTPKGIKDIQNFLRLANYYW